MSDNQEPHAEAFDNIEAMLDPGSKSRMKDKLGVFQSLGVLIRFTGLLFVFAVPTIAQQANGPVGEKAKSRLGKVYTEEDLSRLPKDGISIVGQETSSEPSSSPVGKVEAKPASGDTRHPAVPDDKYWRSRAHALQDKMNALDQKIAIVRENIADAAGRGYHIHTDSLDLSLADLLNQKEELQKQIAELAEEARKAGADPGWLR
jgi:hypothetical protein